MLDHMNDTFITPVFNGSTSLRDAAGQMIENVAKSVRRKETIDDAYMEKLFDEVTALYHLDTATSMAQGKLDLGPLPQTAKILLASLIAAWGVILSLIFRKYRKYPKKH